MPTFVKDCHLENHLTASSGVQGLNEIVVAIKNDGVAATKEKIHQWFSVFSTLPNYWSNLSAKGAEILKSGSITRTYFWGEISKKWQIDQFVNDYY